MPSMEQYVWLRSHHRITLSSASLRTVSSSWEAAAASASSRCMHPFSPSTSACTLEASSAAT
jgi:hypothetical protein